MSSSTIFSLTGLSGSAAISATGSVITGSTITGSVTVTVSSTVTSEISGIVGIISEFSFDTTVSAGFTSEIAESQSMGTPNKIVSLSKPSVSLTSSKAARI